MAAANTTLSSMVKSITIKDIELRTQEKRKLPFARQHRITFAVGNTSRSTVVAKEKKNHTDWDNTFYFDGDDRAILHVSVYQKHRIGREELVGNMYDTIGEVLEKLKNGVLEQQLRTDTSDPSGITIKFTLTTELRGAVGADDRQATHAVISATEAVIPISSTPKAVETLNSTVDAGANIALNVQKLETTGAWTILMDRIEILNKIVTGIAEIHPYTSLAWSVLSAANQVLLKQKERDDKVVRLASTMSDVFAFVQDAEPLKAVEAHVNTIILLVKQVTECGYFITEYAKQNNFLSRTAKYTISDIDTRIASYEDKLRELKTAFLEGVAVQTEITVVHMMNLVESTAESIDLNDMPYASGARFEQEKQCLPGTRESLLADIYDVLNDPSEDAPCVCLLVGVAGSGKSAVAHSIARLYDDHGRLGSSYCFSRTDVASRNPKNLFSTIARDLSDHDPLYKSALWSVVKDNRALRTSQSPMEQAEKLIIGPRKDLDAIGPLIVVIDAVDESGDRASRRLLLRAIVERIAKNVRTTNLRFLVTSRPEDDILTELSSSPEIVLRQMGDVPARVIDGDIERFIYYCLYRFPELEQSWPNQEWCRLLVQHSQQLFQWASTACSFIEGEGTAGLDPRERLDILLRGASTDGSHSLDTLYQTILEQIFTLDHSRERFQTVMAIVLALKEPLSLGSLSALFGASLNIRAIIKPMGSLLDGVLDEERPIRPLHTSFRDFLLDPARSSAFHVHILPQHSLRLGRALLACMRNMLLFNICDLKDSRIRNTAVRDLPLRVDRAIPPHLAYACQYWMLHLLDDHTPDLLNEITLFFKAFLPFWLEAVSLLSLSSPLSSIPSALHTCTILQEWAKNHELSTLASETSQFIQVFAPVLRESTPHLYLSAMPQTPIKSPLCQLWLKHLWKHVSVSSEHPANWPAEVHSLQGHIHIVASVSCSPDGTHIVSASWDGTIRVWNARTGQCVLGPLQGHLGWVLSVAYSPDGFHIASSSQDKTIRVWDATTGQCVAGPFQGHKGAILSVTYSPDGIHIASGSADKTIWVWSTSTGQCVVDPFKGHSGAIYSIAYSPDGNHIVSGSGDKTLRVWNVSTGQCEGDPLQGHMDAIFCVAYSPDGVHIASGSKDKTVRLWNVSSGQCVAGPFQVHNKPVWSVAFSPDGIHVASGSEDKTIRVWNATTGHCVCPPFLGHTDALAYVAFSPDGTHIISGSSDHTVKVWNVVIDQLVAYPFQGHTDSVPSVAYSPDGVHIASGSWDNTIRVWDAITGQCVAGPFIGHTDRVWFVAYSPDGTHIASGSEDNTIRVWDVVTGQCVCGSFEGHMLSIACVAYSSDGTCIVSGSFDKTIRVWNASTGQCVAGPFEGHTEGILSVAYSPNGVHLVSGSFDKTIRIWDASSGQCVTDPFYGHTHAVTSVAYSPDGLFIASGSRDNTIRVWNASTGQCLTGSMKGHSHWINSIAYTPNGIHIISASSDRTIRLWNATTGQCVAGPFAGHTSWTSSVASSPDGRYVVTGSGDKSIKVWKMEQLLSFGNISEKDGWLYSSDGTCFGWIAPWNRHAFHLPVHSLVIASDRYYSVDQQLADTSLLGDSWASCWN